MPAESNPGFVKGQVPSASDWNSYFSAKQDAFGDQLTIPAIAASGLAVSFLSAELIADSNLATNPVSSGWTINDAVWTPGHLAFTYNGSNNPVVTIPVSLITGATYLLVVSGMITADIGSASFDNQSWGGAWIGALGSIIFTADADGADNLNLDYWNHNSGFSFNITAVSLRQIAAETAFALTAANALGVGSFTAGDYQGNVSIGYGACFAPGVKSSNNVRIGYGAGGPTDAAANNGTIAIGQFSLASVTAAYGNVAVGNLALSSLTTGTGNVAIGQKALAGVVTTEGNNTAIGRSAAIDTAGVTNATLIGANTIVSADSAIAIGSGAHATIAHTAQIGASNVVAAFIGTKAVGLPKITIAAGAAAGNITISGITTADRLDGVISFTAGVPADLTSEFTITGANTINNAGHTNTTGKTLMVNWTNLH